MWPKERTAFLVIHGIGEQNPFETLDSFVRGFLKVMMENNPGRKISVKHYTKPWIENGKLEWVENFISFVKEDQPECSIDFYEYYWAYRMEGEITFQELVDWLVKTSDGAGTFYNENKEIVEKYELKSGEYWYLKHLGWFLRLIAFLKISKIPYFDFWYPFIEPFVSKGKQLFIDYMGDVAIYTTTDVKSKHFNIRKSILDESVKEVKSLIDDTRYKKIIIVGHSLGSVIAFDTLNRLTQEANIDQGKWCSVEKIEGLITFGSPLDKIAFFFREHTPEEQCIRRQILAHFHCFKNKDLNLQKADVEVDNPIVPLLDDVKWINFWDKKDPVSGHLDFYILDDDDNIELHMKDKDKKSGKEKDVKFGLAHTKYWECDEMYTEICKRFL